MNEVRCIYRSRINRKIAGICGGLGKYFAVDPIIFRLVWLGLFFLGGVGLILYIIAWIVIPLDPFLIIEK